MIRKILVPVDFSPASQIAILYAADLAKRYGASITAAHVYQHPGYYFPEGFVAAGPEATEEFLGRIDEALAETRAEIIKSGATEVHTLRLEGTPFAEIVRAARNGHFDLIVMGTHGRTGLRHALLGSVAEKVVRKAACPVLTVREPGRSFEMP